MRLPLIAALLVTPCLGDPDQSADLQVFPPIRLPAPPQAWLGLDVAKPDESISAHLPSLPPGIGFVVKSIEKGGPADAAGLKEFDILWKLGDQMLVNHSQLAALLRLNQPGQEVSLVGFRAGKPLEVKLKLGTAPDRPNPVESELLDGTIIPGEFPGPLRERVVNLFEKTANYSGPDGKLQIQQEADGFFVTIVNPSSEIIFEQKVAPVDDLDEVPEAWQRRVAVMRRELAERIAQIPQRQPRPRVVPPPAVERSASHE